MEESLTRITELHAEYPEYIWYPGVLANASWSSEYLAHQLHKHVAHEQHSSGSGSGDVDELKEWINSELVRPGLGISDATEAELASVARHPAAAQPAFAKMVSDRAQVGWSTHGHSAVDVNIYSSGGPGTDALRANVENTDVGRFLRDYLAVDVADVTRELNEKRKANAANAAEAAAAPGLATGHDEGVEEEEDHWAAHEAMEAHRLEEAEGSIEME